MHMRGNTQIASAPAHRPVEKKSVLDAFSGLARTTLLVVSSLIGCALLIAVGTVLSLSWTVHPLLALALTIPMTWLLARLAGTLFWSNSSLD